MSDKEYRELQEALVFRPDMGDVIRESGGLRKVRWKLEGLGKSGGARVIYYNKRTLENWEQGRRHPTGPAKALLKILNADPESAIRALHG